MKHLNTANAEWYAGFFKKQVVVIQFLFCFYLSRQFFQIDSFPSRMPWLGNSTFYFGIDVYTRRLHRLLLWQLILKHHGSHAQAFAVFSSGRLVLPAPKNYLLSSHLHEWCSWLNYLALLLWRYPCKQKKNIAQTWVACFIALWFTLFHKAKVEKLRFSEQSIFVRS